MLDSDSVDVGDGAVLSLLMTFSRNVATVSGDVQVSDDQPKQPSHVVLVSDEAVAFPDQRNVWLTLDQSFHFSIPRCDRVNILRLLSGRQTTIFGTTPISSSFFVRRARKELHEKEQMTLHLKLITKEEIDDARKRLGL